MALEWNQKLHLIFLNELNATTMQLVFLSNI